MQAIVPVSVLAIVPVSMQAIVRVSVSEARVYATAGGAEVCDDDAYVGIDMESDALSTCICTADATYTYACACADQRGVSAVMGSRGASEGAAEEEEEEEEEEAPHGVGVLRRRLVLGEEKKGEDITVASVS